MFEQTVKALWNKKHPEVKLNFIDWDSYSGEVPDDLDVFVFDTLNLDTFSGKGYLMELSKEEIQDYDVFNDKELLTGDSHDGDTVCNYLQAMNDEYQRYTDSYPPPENDTLSECSVEALEKNKAYEIRS